MQKEGIFSYMLFFYFQILVTEVLITYLIIKNLISSDSNATEHQYISIFLNSFLFSIGNFPYIAEQIFASMLPP